MGRTLRQEARQDPDRRGCGFPTGYPQGGVAGGDTKPPGRVVRRSPSPCERRTRYPGGFDAGERRTPGAPRVNVARPCLWTDLGMTWGQAWRVAVDDG